MTNIPFLRHVIQSPGFQEGDYDTGFLTGDSEIAQPEISEESLKLAQALAAWAVDGVSSQRPPLQAGPAPSYQEQHNPWRTAGKLRLP